jgi:hypothetical protein
MPTNKASPWTRDETCIIETTQRAHSCCRSCDDSIEVGVLRVGLVFQHENGYICVNWYHFNCYKRFEAIPVKNLEGFRELSLKQQTQVLTWANNANQMHTFRHCSRFQRQTNLMSTLRT